jgi:predicted lipoprotein with Yx(FWY)xxD motif
MNRLTQFLGAAAVVVVLSGCASMGQPVYAVQERDGILTTPSGMTLYTFDKDVAGSGKSVCNGPCAANWPPVRATAIEVGLGEWSVITRDDGTKQWAYKGKPLYTWVKDAKPGDRTGDGFNNAWRVAKP